MKRNHCRFQNRPNFFIKKTKKPKKAKQKQEKWSCNWSTWEISFFFCFFHSINLLMSSPPPSSTTSPCHWKKSEKSSPDSYSPGRYSLNHHHFGRKTLDLILLAQTRIKHKNAQQMRQQTNKRANSREPRLAELECGWHTVERMKTDENVLTRWHSSVIYIDRYKN